MRRIYSKFRTKDGRVITLRPLRKSDLDEMVPFANAFVKERKRNRSLGVTGFYRQMTVGDEKEFLDKVLEMEAKRRGVSVGAFYGRKIVGHCDISGRVSPDELHSGLLGIVIADGYRGTGLGSEMVQTALDEARKLGIWMIELEVFANNAQARHVYEKAGFKEVGVIPMKIRRDGRFVDIIRMYTHLPHN